MSSTYSSLHAVEATRKVVHQKLGARVAMGLENGPDPLRAPITRGREGGPDLGGVMAIVVTTIVMPTALAL